MTTAAIPLLAPMPAADGVRGIHELLDQVGRVRTVNAGGDGAGGGYDVAGGVALVREVDRAISRLQALRLTTVAALDRARVGDASGMSGTGA